MRSWRTIRMTVTVIMTIAVMMTVMIAVTACGGSGETEIPQAPISEGDLLVEFEDEPQGLPDPEPAPTRREPEPTPIARESRTTPEDQTDSPSPVPEPEPTPQPTTQSHELQGLALLAFEQAERLASQKRYPQAIAAYREAIRKHPYGSHLVFEGMARAHWALEQHEQAHQQFTKALETKKDPIIYVQRGMVSLELDQCEPATLDAKLATAVPPIARDGLNSHAQGNYILAACYQEENRPELAHQHIELAVASAPPDTYDALRLHEILTLQEAIRGPAVTGPTPETAVNGATNGANTTPRPTIAPTPAPVPEFSPKAMEMVENAQTLLAGGEYQEAKTLLEQLDTIHTTPSATILALWGDAHSGLGQRQDAIKHFNRAANIQKDPVVITKLAQLYEDSLDADEAIRYAKEAINLPTGYWEVHQGKTRYSSRTEAGLIVSRRLKGLGDYKEAYAYINMAHMAAHVAEYPQKIIQEIQDEREILGRILEALRGQG